MTILKKWLANLYEEKREEVPVEKCLAKKPICEERITPKLEKLRREEWSESWKWKVQPGESWQNISIKLKACLEESVAQLSESWKAEMKMKYIL